MQMSFRNYLFYVKRVWLNPYFWLIFIGPYFWGGGFSFPVNALVAVIFIFGIPFSVLAETHYNEKPV